MTQDQKFFFVHIMKTAGGTLRRHIRANFAEDEVYPVPRLEPDLRKASFRLDLLAALPEERRRRTRVFTGHFPYMAVDVLGLPLTTITVLREPVARTISYLRAHRLRQEEGLSLEEIYEQPFWFRGFIRDHQAKLFALKVEDEPRSYMRPLEVDAGRLALAKANLAKVDVIGLQETFDDLLAELHERFGWNMASEEDMHVNPGRRDVPESFRRRIAADSPADMEFYAYAQELCAARRRSRRTAGEGAGGGGTV